MKKVQLTDMLVSINEICEDGTMTLDHVYRDGSYLFGIFNFINPDSFPRSTTYMLVEVN